MSKSGVLDEVFSPALSSFISVSSPVPFLFTSSRFTPFPPHLSPADLLSALLHQSRRVGGGHTSFLASSIPTLLWKATGREGELALVSVQGSLAMLPMS